MIQLVERAKTICLDADDTTNNHISEFAAFHNLKYGTSFKVEDFWTRQLDLVLGCSGEDTIKRMDEFQHSSDFQKIVPLPGAIEAIKFFYSMGKGIYIVTSREDSLRKDTEKFYDFYCRGKIKDVIHSVNGHTGRMNSGKTKGEICQSLGNALLFDDDLSYINQCPNSILFGDYAWQKDADKPGVERLKKWRDLNAN